jgi:hypothetical protein
MKRVGPRCGAASDDQPVVISIFMSENKSVPASPPPPPAVNSKQLAKLNSPLFIWPATVVLAVLLFFGLGYLFDVLTHESTDDAFIAAHVVSIAPRSPARLPPFTFSTTKWSARTNCWWKLTRRNLRHHRRAETILFRRLGSQLQDGARRARFDGRKSGHRRGHRRPVEGRCRRGGSHRCAGAGGFSAQPGIAEAEHHFGAGI